MRLLINTVLLIAVCHTTTAIASPLSAPRGWTETLEADIRVLRKGSSRLHIGPWKSLNGQALDAYLKSIEHIVPSGVTFVSSKGTKPEGKDGAYTVTRKVKINGKDGTSILYGCPGQPGYARIIEGSFENTSFGNILSGGLFADKVCKKEPKGGKQEAVGVVLGPETTISNASAENAEFNPNSTSPNTPTESSGNLAVENSKIPYENRPLSAVTITKIVLSGFNPVIPVPVGRMVVKYPNGYSTWCTKWNMLTQEPTPQSIGSKKCEVSKTIPESWGSGPTPLDPFAKGERVNLAFGSISGATYNFGGAAGTAGHLSHSDLIMTEDGRIAFGNKVFSETPAGWSNTRKQHTGRYYLDGYTLTVQTDDGKISHTTIGILQRKNGRVTSLFLANKYYSEGLK